MLLKGYFYTDMDFSDLWTTGPKGLGSTVVTFQAVVTTVVTSY